MAFLDKLERSFGWLAIRNLSLYLVMGQVAVLFAAMFQMIDLERLIYAPVLVLEGGEWWRLVTFMFVVPVPPPTAILSFVFLAFGWYLFYLMGGALEAQWGAFRFNAFLFTSYALTILLTFLAPNSLVTNAFILGSVFIAFAYLNPDFELMMFFILPVKIKWLALIACVLGGYRFLVGGIPTKLQIGAAVIAFLFFFAGDMIRTLRQGRRVATRRAEKAAEVEKPRHVCFVCGKTDKSHPQLDFRYCSKCAGDQCYCPEHIQNHAHVVAADDSRKE